MASRVRQSTRDLAGTSPGQSIRPPTGSLVGGGCCRASPARPPMRSSTPSTRAGWSWRALTALASRKRVGGWWPKKQTEGERRALRLRSKGVRGRLLPAELSQEARQPGKVVRFGDEVAAFGQLVGGRSHFA